MPDVDNVVNLNPGKETLHIKEVNVEFERLSSTIIQSHIYSLIV